MSSGSRENKVILCEHLDAEVFAWLSQQVQLVKLDDRDPSALKTQLADARGLLVRTYTRVDRELLDSTHCLKVIGRAGVGLDNIDVRACRERGVEVVYTPDANSQAVVEYIFALILDAVRPRVYLDSPPSSDDFHRWRREAVGVQMDQLVLGILGVGRIGRRVAEVAGALGMRIICNDLRPVEELGLPPGWPGTFVEKEVLWREADVLTIHVDGRAENRHLVDTPVLDRLKPTCTLINAARGSLIDVGALSSWAKKVRSSGGMAILDVHDPEPPGRAYPLWACPNVKLLPHLASRTDIAMKNMSWVARDLVRVLNGEAPRWPAPE